MKTSFQILLYYKYVHIENPKGLREAQVELCERLNLKGRIIIAKEGINGTVEGTKEATAEYIRFITADSKFKNIRFKKSQSDGNSFPKLSIKVRDEIVSAHLGNDISPLEVAGQYLTPEELHNLIHSDQKFYIVDMRNDYEQAVGYFANGLLAPFTNFRDLPKMLPILKDLKDELIVTVCTGGVRCEKASGYLLQNGFNQVFQLEGGIFSYMEKYPNEDFLGKLYVFDGRVTMGFNTEDPNHVIVGKCIFCQGPADCYYDCQNLYCKGKRHFISCKSCLEKNSGLCQKDSQNLTPFA